MRDSTPWLLSVVGVLLVLISGTIATGGLLLAFPVVFGYGLERDAVILFAVSAGLLILAAIFITAAKRLERRQGTNLQ